MARKKKDSEEFVYYTTDAIDKQNAIYNIIIGERSNGKTTAVLNKFLKEYISSGYKKQFAIIRRWEEDYKKKAGARMFENIVALGWVAKYTNGEYNSIRYTGSDWRLIKVEENGETSKVHETPMAFAFALSSEQHYKSLSYPHIKNIVFDEFLTRSVYLPNEFILFQSVLSTIIRLKDDVKIYMLGNTVNKYCPYFEEMGLTNIKRMTAGSIDLYTYGNTGLTVAVEYCSNVHSDKKKSNKYFAFNNPRLQMITRGSWEIDIYPHLPLDCHYKPKNKIFSFYIEFQDEKFEGEVVILNENMFAFIHRKTTPITEKYYPVYSLSVYPRYNYSSNIFKARNQAEQLVTALFKDGKIFYQDNEVGESIRNFLLEMKKQALLT